MMMVQIIEKKLKGRNSTAIILREIRDGKESHEYQLLCSNCNHIKILPMRKNSFRIQVTQERNYREHLRELVLVKLGGICACCGESNRKLLTIDHIDGDGNAHRKKIGGYVKMLRYIRDLVDTSMFQVLCWNCNMSKGIGTVCIHKRNYV